jgi:1-acyl-sn-glycerol-3-phosphate acyltransferase
VRRLRRVARRTGRGLAATLVAIGRARLARGEDPRARAERLRGALAEVGGVHDLAIAVRGAWPDRPAVLVANHVSYLDPLAIASQLPCAPIAKGEVAGWPIIGAAARALGVSFVDRSSAHSGARALRRSLAALRAGACVLNFPEGTTTDGTRVLPFRRGVFGLARIAGVPIVPVALRYASADLAWYGGATFLPHYLRTAARRAPAVEIAIGAPMAADHPAGELAELARQRIAQLLRDLEEHSDATVVRLRVPAPRPDPVLPPPGRAAARAS